MDSQPQTKRLTLMPEWRDNRLSFVASIKPSPGGAEAARPQLDSPLTQQARPDVFEQKVVGLYKHLFTDTRDEDIPSGFWAELFLLPPNLPQLRELLEEADSDDLLHIQQPLHQLLIQSIAATKLGRAPADEHALDVLAGLDNIDAIFHSLVASLDDVINNDDRTISTRLKAVRTAIAVVSGGYQTALVSYFVHNDFFPSLTQLIQHLAEPIQASDPLLLLGLLANHGKFESHNPYRTRFAEFVHDETMEKIVESVGQTSSLLRAKYIAIQDDTPVGWSMGNTLSYVGLGALAGAKPAQPVLTEEQQRELFAEQPSPETSSLMTVYDFATANKLFCRHFVTQEATDKEQAAPFSLFLSHISYLYQHAYRSARAASYAYLTLLTLLVLVEDTAIAKQLCEITAPIRLCRQRPPLLPLPKGDRSYAASIIDLLVDGMNHNLRKRLDTAFYTQTLTVMTRMLTYLTKSRTKLQYHWSELWRSLLSFVRFLNQYAEDIRTLPGSTHMVQALVDLLALALTGGEAILPDAAAYDDLFYKLLESGDALVKLRDTYQLGKSGDKQAAINTLIGVSQHYAELIESQKAKKEHLSPREVQKIIRQGYDTLNVEAKDGDQAQVRGFREADHRSELKKIVRVVVADAVVVIRAS
ncbi:hypothetical protein LTR10_008885 [Elasticomyces elasticus]|nr:hypothetical protein LTR10_008885 [Elasticomyces elasticus]KAK4974142.1 hypothetical protein LTR42_004781 [Elasticomyces elasticus]